MGIITHFPGGSHCGKSAVARCCDVCCCWVVVVYMSQIHVEDSGLADEGSVSHFNKGGAESVLHF